eukprot:TRINITY_DN42135_c0_g1_i1.p1 TRINITY_DN42135_c0_g1~~TRINITY_DN42135_c0_g1_i1.p1  ORF type:complete len:225 (-),score=43.44 TRINITY_DN42135_c0_g1_i1:19-693(-)
MTGSNEDLKKEKQATKTVNREETCPLLLRVFTNSFRHNDLAEYSKGNVPENEIQIYTWLDASLKELTGLIKEVNPDARRRGTRFDFALIYPDLRMGKYFSRDIGSTRAGEKGPDDAKTLSECKFSIGDFMDVAISPPNQRQDRMDYGRRGGFGGGDRFRGGRRGDDFDRNDRMNGDRRGGDRMNGRDRGGRDREDRDRPREDRDRPREDRDDRRGRDRGRDRSY